MPHENDLFTIADKYGKGYNEMTCKQIGNLIDYMTNKHSKALFVRIDITNARDAKLNMERKHITRILENTKRTLERKFKNSPNKLDLQYVWTTEQTPEAPHPHYHLFVGVNGNAMQNGHSIMAAMQPHVQKVQQTNKCGLVHISKEKDHCGVMCDRNKEDYESQKAKAFESGKYLAKLYSKELNPKWARFSSASRLPHAARVEENPCSDAPDKPTTTQNDRSV